jgi:hypothetical protein
LILTGGLLWARVTAVPEIADPTGAALPPSLHLHAPWLYVMFAPLFTAWDGISMLSQSRLEGFLLGLPVIYLLFRGAVAMGRRRWSWRREAGLLGASIASLLVFLSAGLLWHRPMIALAGVPPDLIVADLHSHTRVSHDVRNTLMRGYDVGANLRWHRRAGFDAVFITDHNTVEGLGPPTMNPVRCPGTEVSAWKAHVVLLGDTVLVDRTRYNGSLGELEALLQSSDSAYGALSLLSLPEYDRNHWRRLDTLVAAGADGFEIVNASPKAAEFSLEHRNAVVALARYTNRFVAGVSDSHGWGATSLAWNLIAVPGWRTARDPCTLILNRLRTGFSSNQIVERHHLRAESGWPGWLTPIGTIWEMWRTMGTPLLLSWLGWTWALWVVRRGRP